MIQIEDSKKSTEAFRENVGIFSLWNYYPHCLDIHYIYIHIYLEQGRRTTCGKRRATILVMQRCSTTLLSDTAIL